MDKNNLTDLENAILLRLHYYINRREKVKIETLAADCYVSKAAIVKLAKKLGYSGYSEMRYSLMERQAKKFSVDCSTMMLPSSNPHLAGYVDHLSRLFYENRENKIFLNSVGVCDAAMEYFYHRLLMFGFDVVTSYHFSTFHTAHPGLFFFMSFSGCRPEMLEKLPLASECGFTTIALTANGHSPVAQEADVSIEIEGIRTPVADYQPNLFTANIIVLLELVMTRYSECYLKNQVSEDGNT